MDSDNQPNLDEGAIDHWVSIAETKICDWQPSPLNDLLRTDRRDEYQFLLTHPEYSLGLMKRYLGEARQRPVRPFHIQNIEAPGGCWEIGTQIDPARVKVGTPDGRSFVLYVYQLIYALTRAVLLNDSDQVRHMCNNRACIRPDHLDVGSAQQNKQDDERRKYAGNSPKGRGQTLHAHIPKTLQQRPDPWVPEPLEREEVKGPPGKPNPKTK